jgi:hypothetical protein
VTPHWLPIAKNHPFIEWFLFSYHLLEYSFYAIFFPKSMTQDVPSVESDEKPKVELWEFIDKYQKTLAVVGVFMALGLFWKTIHSKESTPYLAYLCFLITVPLLIEVWRGYSYETASWNLRFFFNVFSGIILFTTGNLIVEYPEHFATIVAGGIWSVIGISLISLQEKVGSYLKTRKYNRTVQRRLELIEEFGHSETTNELVGLSNKTLVSYYQMVNGFRALWILLSVIIAFSVFFYTESFLKAFVDIEVRQRQLLDVSQP